MMNLKNAAKQKDKQMVRSSKIIMIIIFGDLQGGYLVPSGHLVSIKSVLWGHYWEGNASYYS